LTPVRKVIKPISWIAPERALRRYRYKHGSSMATRFVKTGVDMVALAAYGAFHSWMMRTEDFRTVVETCRRTNVQTISEINRLLNAYDYRTGTRVGIALRILNFIESDSQVDDIHRLVDLPLIATTATAHYRPVNDVEDFAPYAITLCPPILAYPAIYPADTEANFALSAVGRVENLVNAVVPPMWVVNKATEYVDLVVASVGQQAPATHEQVLEHWDTPAKHGKLRRNWGELGAMVTNWVSGFIKREAYSRPVEPRMIQQQTPSHNYALGNYIYPLYQALKSLHWWMPGKTPPQIQDAVMSLSMQEIFSCDFSRFDGRISKWLKLNIEWAIYKRVYGLEEQERLAHLCAQEHLRVVKRQGGTTTFVLKHARMSGSLTTTIGNTLISGFVAYLFARNHYDDKNEAFRNLGLVYGDDLLLPSNSRRPLDVTRILGLKLVLATVRPYAPIPFLSRWFIRGGSFCDPMRALAKIHTAIPRGLDLPMTAANRALGYLVTDGNTPIVSEICRYLMAKYGVEDAEYEYGHDHEWDIKVNMGPWEQPEIEEMSILIAKLLRIEPRALTQITDRITSARDDTTYPTGIIENDSYVTTVPVEVLDGNVIFVIDAPEIESQSTPTPTATPTLGNIAPTTNSSSSVQRNNNRGNTGNSGDRRADTRRGGNRESPPTGPAGSDNNPVDAPNRPARSSVSRNTVGIDSLSSPCDRDQPSRNNSSDDGQDDGHSMPTQCPDGAPPWLPDALAPAINSSENPAD